MLLNELEIPPIPAFHPKKGAEAGTWEYMSGQNVGATNILSVLKGTIEVLND